MELHDGSSTKAHLAALGASAPNGLIGVDEASAALGTPRTEAAARLARLAKSGWLARVRRGLYYILPIEAATKGQTTYPDPWVLASRAYDPCYVGGWSAAEHWGLTEQLFRSTFVATAAVLRSRQQRLLGLEFRLANVRRERLAGVAFVWRGSARVAVSGAERTLVDAFRDPTWLGGMRHTTECLRRYFEGDRAARVATLIEEMTRSGNGAAAKRLGFILEQDGTPSELLDPLSRMATKGLIALDPSVARGGRIVRRWGIVVNADLV